MNRSEAEVRIVADLTISAQADVHGRRTQQALPKRACRGRQNRSMDHGSDHGRRKGCGPFWSAALHVVDSCRPWESIPEPACQARSFEVGDSTVPVEKSKCAGPDQGLVRAGHHVRLRTLPPERDQPASKGRHKSRLLLQPLQQPTELLTNPARRLPLRRCQAHQRHNQSRILHAWHPAVRILISA